MYRTDGMDVHMDSGDTICSRIENGGGIIMLTIKSNRNFLSNQGDVTLGLMIKSGQFFNSSEISSMSPPYLQVSGSSDQN